MIGPQLGGEDAVEGDAPGLGCGKAWARWAVTCRGLETRSSWLLRSSELVQGVEDGGPVAEQMAAPVHQGVGAGNEFVDGVDAETAVASGQPPPRAGQTARK